MAQWMQILLLVKEILILLRDKDGDGVKDIFDNAPENPEVQ